jgi:DNA-binding transcriptional LysR family regulator
MDLRALRYCESIARLGSFTKAAQEVHVAQPAMSMAVAKLEEELGTKLFVRLPRGAVATPEGEVLVARALRIFDEIDSAKRELQDASDLATGRIRVGFPPMYGLHYLPQLLSGFHERYPGIDISAEVGSATEIRDKLEAGDIDIGMLETRRVDRRWNSVIVGKDELVLGVSSRHPLGARKSVTPRELDGLEMVMLSRSYLQRQVFDKLCEQHQVRYRQVMECNFVPMTIFAAQEGYGATTLLSSLVANHPGLVGVSFTPKQYFRFALCWHQDRYLSKANQAFVQYVKTVSSMPDASVRARRA